MTDIPEKVATLYAKFPGNEPIQSRDLYLGSNHPYVGVGVREKDHSLVFSPQIHRVVIMEQGGPEIIKRRLPIIGRRIVINSSLLKTGQIKFEGVNGQEALIAGLAE